MAKMDTSQFDTRSAGRSRTLPVQTAIPNKGQVLNSTGGYVWSVNDWDRLTRFLVLGTEGGTYYVKEPDLLKGSHGAVMNCLAADPSRTIQTIVDISTQGRAYRNEPALFALAVAASVKDEATRKLALAAVLRVCRIGTHLYHFMDYVSKQRGLGRGLRTALAEWYTTKTPEQLALQVVKYQQRDGWSARDLLRLAHPHAKSISQEAVFRWVVGGLEAAGERTVKRKTGNRVYPDVRKHLPKFIEAFEEAKTASDKRLVELIVEHNLPREAVPTPKLNSLDVWDALLQKMPLTAMIRNLAKMTAIGLIKPLSASAKLVQKRLKDAGYLYKSRVHPMQVLVATKIYAQGHGDKGSLTWVPVPAVVGALEEAFYGTFPNVRPCGKPLLIGLDVSGSMSSSMAGATALRACEATAALSLVHASVEEDCHIFGFASSTGWYDGSSKFRELGIRKGMSLVEATKRAVMCNFGATDISLAVQYALDHKLDVGGFLVMTDNECNSGRHVNLALKEYREKRVEDARLVVVATTSTGFTVNDPNDKFGLDVVGFDPTVPSVIADFIRGEQPAAPVETEE
jgi:60 kDa SS-A/Ro ribonucleoprotein